MGLLDGKVAVITGAGRGIGREHALLMAKEGASVLVNDLGGDGRGEGADLTPAQSVVEEIEAIGGKAAVNGANVADWKAAEAMVQQAVATFGRLDILVNNAGILRDRMTFNMEEEEWDVVLNVVLKGTFAPSRHAAAYWREQFKATDQPQNGVIINTSSESGLYSNGGQANYAAAKAGSAALGHHDGAGPAADRLPRERYRPVRRHPPDRYGPPDRRECREEGPERVRSVRAEADRSDGRMALLGRGERRHRADLLHPRRAHSAGARLPTGHGDRIG